MYLYTMKECNSCKDEKPLKEFYKNKTRADGYNNKCKKCSKKYHDTWYLKNKDKVYNSNKKRRLSIAIYIEEYRKTCSCNKCGDTRHYVLDFHHIKDKKFGIAQASSNYVSLIKLHKELSKCKVLCANCHRELHYLNSGVTQ